MIDLIRQELGGTFRAVPFPVALLRVVAALLLAGLVGAEREWRRKPAGLRTHMLVSLAACLYAIIGRELSASDLLGAADQLRVDPMNLIGAVTSGVAFLVAGIIITTGGRVHNITTGASLWLAGAIGLACGVGKIPLAMLTTLVVLLVLVILATFVRPENQDD
ncbi:MgtC/SapB family protein [Rubellimicrobium aerolatum]|uniref:Protein MgtC n=1 Tax=Rubellimicrobium aerolatum TaxID=490979 RepID=A0ABW0SBA5_9RHOB|nr:MgtC/SapB family protein [Rubellimicrobium aerolatum]MBP1805441.1 putative Mg2+ transporter-C (MgtC) family protein [Rubellimicrobium aerolatum]